MLKNIELYKCSGCGACINVCPLKIIKVSIDQLTGFIIPVIDEGKCVHCGLCNQACIYNYIDSSCFSLTKKCVIAKNIDSDLVLSSSSGGVFIEIAKYILKREGVVYGAVFEKNKILHKRATSYDEVKKMQGSKYVQSDLTNVFYQVKNDLINGLRVLFTGSPCQIYGLKKSLCNTNTENLVTQDFICHGVSSPKIFSHYLENKCASYRSNVKHINFRSKSLKNETQAMSLKFENGKEYLAFPTHDEFYKLYLKNIILRPSCYDCKFTSYDRCSDMTLGDYWGDKCKLNNKINSQSGVSCVLINTKIGNKIFKKIEKNFVIQIVDNDFVLQPNLKKSTQKNVDSDRFWNICDKFCYDKAIMEIVGSLRKLYFMGFVKKLASNLGLLTLKRFFKT